MPNYGDNPPPPPVVADWLLGGHRKRLVVQALAAPSGWGADDLASELGIGRSTVHETFRALRAAGALTRSPSGGWVLDRRSPLGAALRDVVVALMPLDGVEVDLPRRQRPRRRAVGEPGPNA